MTCGIAVTSTVPVVSCIPETGISASQTGVRKCCLSFLSRSTNIDILALNDKITAYSKITCKCRRKCMQKKKKEPIMNDQCKMTIPSFGITVRHHLASFLIQQIFQAAPKRPFILTWDKQAILFLET